MKRLSAILAVAAFAATAIPYQAQAYCRGCAVGAGVIGGIAAGAIIGNAIANSQARAQGYDGPVYAAPPPPPGIEPADVDPYEANDSAACHIEKQSMWDERGRRRWTNVEVCE